VNGRRHEGRAAIDLKIPLAASLRSACGATTGFARTLILHHARWLLWYTVVLLIVREGGSNSKGCQTQLFPPQFSMCISIRPAKIVYPILTASRVFSTLAIFQAVTNVVLFKQNTLQELTPYPSNRSTSNILPVLCKLVRG
jgi:hypothetical protein